MPYNRAPPGGRTRNGHGPPGVLPAWQRKGGAGGGGAKPRKRKKTLYFRQEDAAPPKQSLQKYLQLGGVPLHGNL